MNSLNVLAGLNGLVDTFIDNWIGPLFILAIAGFSLLFLKNREFTKLATFIVIAVVVGLLIFFGPAFFGRDGNLTNAVSDVAKNVNIITSLL